MQSRFFEYCSLERDRPAAGGLIVRRRRPSVALPLLLLLQLGTIAWLVATRAELSWQPLVPLVLLVLGVAAYCLDAYRSIREPGHSTGQSARCSSTASARSRSSA